MLTVTMSNRDVMVTGTVSISVETKEVVVSI